MSDLVRKGSEIEPPKSERCKRCFKPIKEDGHAGMCSSDCAEASRQDLSQDRLRALVLERDKGICVLCKTDTLAIREDLDKLKRMADASAANDPRARQLWSSRVHFYLRMGYDRESLEGTRALWEADHRVPKAAGGASTLDQMRTLCIPDHRKVSGKFASSRAAARKPRGRFGR